MTADTWSLERIVSQCENHNPHWSITSSYPNGRFARFERRTFRNTEVNLGVRLHYDLKVVDRTKSYTEQAKGLVALDNIILLMCRRLS